MQTDFSSSASLLINQLKNELNELLESSSNTLDEWKSQPVYTLNSFKGSGTIFDFKGQFENTLNLLNSQLLQDSVLPPNSAENQDGLAFMGNSYGTVINHSNTPHNNILPEARLIHQDVRNNIQNITLQDIDNQLHRFTDLLRSIDTQLFTRFNDAPLANIVTSGLSVTQKSGITLLKESLGFDSIIIDSLDDSFLPVSFLIMTCVLCLFPSSSYLCSGLPPSAHRSHCNNNLAKYRTLKYLQALLLGICVLNVNWVEESLAANKLLNTKSYEIIGCINHSARNGPQKSRFLSSDDSRNQKPREKLLQGLSFVVLGETVPNSPSKNELEKLINLGGGTIIKQDDFSTISLTQQDLVSQGLNQVSKPEHEYESILSTPNSHSRSNGHKKLVIPLCFVKVKKTKLNNPKKPDTLFIKVQKPESVDTLRYSPSFSENKQITDSVIGVTCHAVATTSAATLVNSACPNALQAKNAGKNRLKTALSFLWLFDSIDQYELISDYTEYLVFL